MLTSDAAVSNHLTQFLKHFKATMHSHICFVEVFLGNTSDDEKCKKAQQVYDKQYKIDEENSEITLCKENLKMVERFCLRINEYVEYRFSRVKIEDKQIISELQTLKKTLYSIFFHFTKGQPDLNLQTIINKVSQIQNTHSIKIFQCLLSLCIKSSHPQELQDTLKSMIRSKATKTFDFGRSKNQSQLNQASYQSTRMQKSGKFIQQTTLIKPILRPRRVTLETNLNKKYKSCIEGDYVEQVKTASRFRTKINDISAYSISPSIDYTQQKSSFMSRYPHIEANKNLEGAMDFQLNFEPVKQRGQIMKQLMDLNKKNQVMIRKFMKKCEKKRKKLSSISSTSDAKIQVWEKTPVHKRSNTIEQEPKQIFDIKKKGSILPIIRKKNKV